MKYGNKVSVSQEGEFQLGYLYRTIEEHINRFAAQDGCPFTVADIAVRMGDTLRLKGEEIRKELRIRESLPTLREASGQERAPNPSQNLDVVAQSGKPLKRYLSKKALSAIRLAQKERWAKYHAAKKKSKRTAAQTRAARANAIKARAAYMAKRRKVA